MKSSSWTTRLTFRFATTTNVLKPYTLIQNTENHTVYESYNQGAAVAKGDKLMFIQSDVFVHERTINQLAVYLNKFDMAFPQQIPIYRSDVMKLYRTRDGQEAHIGWRDAGLLAITKEAFERAGGWDGRFRNLLGEKAFYLRCGKAGLTWTSQTNALITHIMAGNNLTKDETLYNDEMDFDAQLMRKEYDENH
jgi:GT2 family glycosyltransferase